MKSHASCLCGAVCWTIKGAPKHASHCHCSMCRKAHGAAYGTYYTVDPVDFEWDGATDQVEAYVSSSSALTRAFCKTCGSVVPFESEAHSEVSVPAGNHDTGWPVGMHIFVASKAPWHDIEDNLKQFDEYPPADSSPVIETRMLAPAQPGILRGSCLCNRIQYRVTKPFAAVHNCYCSRCRHARSATHATNGFTAMDGVEFVQGKEHLREYKLPHAKYFTQVFCDVCGSAMPRIDPARGIAVVPFGSLDDDPGRKPDDNVFVGSKAGWFDLLSHLPSFEEGPA